MFPFTKGISYSAAEGAYWAAQGLSPGTSLIEITAPIPTVYDRVTLVWTRTQATGIAEDVATTSLNLSKGISAGTFAQMDNTDRAAVESALNTWWTSQKGSVSNKWKLLEYRWHNCKLGTPKTGPAVRVTSNGNLGSVTETAAVPDQIATSVTFKTPSRHSWGRMYLPKLAGVSYDTYGRILNAEADNVATYMRTLLLACQTAGCDPVVVSVAHPAFLTIEKLQVDDTPDVIRRRRPKQTDYRKEFTS